MIWDRFSFRLRKRETLVCIRRTATRHKRGGEAEVTVTSKRHAQAMLIMKERKVGFIEITAMRHRRGG